MVTPGPCGHCRNPAILPAIRACASSSPPLLLSSCNFIFYPTSSTSTFLVKLFPFIQTNPLLLFHSCSPRPGAKTARQQLHTRPWLSRWPSPKPHSFPQPAPPLHPSPRPPLLHPSPRPPAPPLRNPRAIMQSLSPNVSVTSLT